MKNLTRTLAGAYVQTCLQLGLDYAMAEKSTLNEKLGINSGVAPTSGTIPKIGYYAIGNGGHTFTVGTDGVPVPEPVQHRARDAAPFSMIPFVLRETSNDLTSTQRAKYALRKTVAVNGVNYYAYYLRRLDLTSVEAELQYKTVASDGTTTTTAFAYDSGDLSPTPQTLASDSANATSGDYVTATAKVTIDFDETDVTELLNVANILYSKESYAIVSEMAICSGVDKTYSASNASEGTFTFNEAIAVQVNAFVNCCFMASLMSGGWTNTFNIGATEPLYEVTSD